ncbi:MAG: endonuclease domain-containing protein [Selenomonas ruminantium]|jgi:very-short-patch-repair endonuclease|uniref:Endonuclease domain-containing protein n=1 Tax=Selenomonas ruminantium TaxID=971 RepID=A0A927ZSZ6_SELRU|nr:endonuclease domain-containing protein [Selenomonas ruminantium]MBE6085841.1 endonuclease domain-containing protein [Selenomonas ruminantium]
MPNITYRHDLKKKSQQLRSNMTKEERHLWYDFLKTYCPQFRRQKTIGNYIADFYCPCCKLVVELDGGQHYEENGQVYDEKRTAYLSDMGITVLRFSNRDIWENFQGVCSQIDRVVEMLLKNKPHPSASRPLPGCPPDTRG